jgi:exodeoxyribonuclease V beta subunit
MTSYSRLSSDAPTPVDEREQDEPPSPLALIPKISLALHFSQGPAAGTCLHSLLERLDFHLPAVRTSRDCGDPGTGRNRSRWQEAVRDWLEDILAVELDGACALGRLDRQDRINELNFLFPLERMDLQRFAGLLESAGFRAPALFGPSLQGLMKGFIDLVCRHQGRYFIVDYKSNYLGPSLADYGPEALAACMDSHSTICSC